MKPQKSDFNSYFYIVFINSLQSFNLKKEIVLIFGFLLKVLNIGFRTAKKEARCTYQYDAMLAKSSAAIHMKFFFSPP